MKNVNPLLLVAAEIKKEYFYHNPTTKSLNEVKEEILKKYNHVHSGEMILLMLLVDREYDILKAKQEELTEA